MDRGAPGGRRDRPDRAMRSSLPDRQPFAYLRLTVTVTGVVCEFPPLVPVTVIVRVPVGVLGIVVTVRWVLADEPSVTVAGANAAEETAGSPDAVNETAPLNAFSEVAVIVYVAVLPRVTVALCGLAPREKSGVAVADRRAATSARIAGRVA